jgi:phage tail protein X
VPQDEGEREEARSYPGRQVSRVKEVLETQPALFGVLEIFPDGLDLPWPDATKSSTKDEIKSR